MTSFDPPFYAVRDVVTRALAEDLGVLGDLTAVLVPPDAHAVAEIESAGRSSAVPDEVVFNLTWIGREEYQARRSGPPERP